jgi:hypothetical protein
MADKTNGDIIAFDMTRQEIIDAVSDVEQELTINDEDSVSYSEYAKAITRGRETLKQAGYYPYLHKEEK